MAGFINDGDIIEVKDGKLTVKVNNNKKTGKKQYLLSDGETTIIATTDKSGQVYMSELPPLSQVN